MRVLQSFRLSRDKLTKPDAGQRDTSGMHPHERKTKELIDDGELECGCGQGAQAVALSSFLFGTASEAASQTLQVTNFAVSRATVSNAVAQTLAPSPARA